MTPEERSDFYVAVSDHQGNPLEGVRIHGGIDWDHFSVFTDSTGKALLPKHAYGLRTSFRKNQYYTISVEELRPDDYILYPTPYIMSEIGEVTGQAVRFTSDQIIAINYDGEYRVYNYDESGVTEEFLLELPYGPRGFRLERDTLWFSAYDGNIYAYYIIDPFNPSLMLQLDIDDGSIIFDRKDSILAAGPYYATVNRPLRVLSFQPDGSVNELYRIEDFIVNQIFFLSDYLVVLAFEHNFLSIFDVSNPSTVRLALVYYLYEPESSFLWGDTLGITYRESGGSFRCRLFEFPDPVTPVMFANFTANGQITEIINDTLAVGRYCTYSYDYGSLCIFNGSILSEFQAIAILSEEGYPEHQGCRPPYFIIGGKLWKLEER